MKSLAVSLYHASGKAYSLISKLFILPTKSSIRRFVSKIPMATGIPQATLNLLKEKVAHMSEMEKLCTLCVDEISLKTHLFYNISDDKIVGVEDFGGGYRTNKVATSGLVFMLRSISGGWKQPLGYALVNNSCPVDTLEDLIKEAIDKLDGIGLNIVVVISDMGSNFYSLSLHLKVTAEKPWFVHNGKRIYLMFDPPHLLKCIRNNLINYTFKFNQYSACWKDVEDFYEKDKILPIRSAPKLTDKHINPTNFQKMKVKYATQVFSHTVAASICTYASMGGLPASSLGTAELLSKFDSLFDCVNSSTLSSVKEFKSAISTNNSHITFLRESIIFIQGIKVLNGDVNVTKRIKSLKGWLVTLNAIICIWNKLQASHNFTFLFTRRLNTDPLENFFGSIRQQGGNCDNPTPIQFTRAFRKLFFSSLLTSSKGNCAKDLDVLLAQFSKMEKRKPKDALLAKDVSNAQILSIGQTDYREQNVSSNIFKDNALAYVSGYLLNKSFKIHSCINCKEVLVSNNLDDNRKQFCFFKAYKEPNFGGLNVPSSCYLEYIIKLEDAFVKSFSVTTKNSNVGANILKVIERIPVPFQACAQFPLAYLQKLFVRMRIYYSIKFANRQFTYTKKKSRKYIKVKHL